MSSDQQTAKSSPPQAPPPRAWVRFAPLIIGLAVAVLWITAFPPDAAPARIAYSELYGLAEQGKVASIVLNGLELSGELKQQETLGTRHILSFRTSLPQQDDKDLLPLLRQQHVVVNVDPIHTNVLEQVALALLPWLLILGAWWWISRRARPGVGLPFSMGERAHRIERQDAPTTRFDDVAGLAGPKRDLVEVVDFLRDPTKFRRLGAKLPRGILLVGPPGTGKTLLARAVAGEAKVPFFYVNGSEFIQIFVGVGAQRVRELFDQAKKVAPSIVFIDELDAVGRARGTGLGGGNDEREQTLNQLLSELDGFTRNDMTVVLAATNRPDVLDPALLRPGRFDRRVVIDRPECAAREAILRVHTQESPLAPDVSLDDLAQNTPGFSGADLANLCNEAALNATRRGADAIHASDFADAMDKIVLGDPRETLLAPDEKVRVATHEAGHATVAHFTQGAEPLQRVSILPRGFALGATQQTEGKDRHLVTQPELEAKLRVLMGGYAAEMLRTGAPSSGAENDLRVATDLAFKMVAHYGMSPRIGPVFHEQRVEHPFLGQRLATDSGTSDVTTHLLEEEVRRLLADGLEAATATLKKHGPAHARLVDALLEHETLEAPALRALLDEKAESPALKTCPAVA